MLERIGHIKNPLTVIAMFAAIAEVSGAGVLPFITSQNQAVYVWFLMMFPVLLVILFFITLNFNHKALYAPSDWKDESNFFRKFTRATAEEKDRKLSEEVAAAEATAAEEAVPEAEQHSSPSQPNPPAVVDVPLRSPTSPSRIDRSRFERYSQIEKLAIAKLSRDLHISFRPHVVFRATKNRRVVFDAVAIERDKVSAVEVKLMFRSMLIPSYSNQILLEAENIARSLRESGKEFVLHYIAVLENKNIDRARAESKLREYLNNFESNIKLHVYDVRELSDRLPKESKSLES